MMLDENENAHYGNRMAPDVPAAQGTKNDSSLSPSSSQVRPSINAQQPQSSAEKKDYDNNNAKKSRTEHKQKILELCQEKLTTTAASQAIIASIKDLYKRRILPLEKKYHLHSLCLPTSGAIQDAEFDARPMVLLLGQYSTGKTSFIRHLLGVDFPGMHIGPEPTSDKFMALIHGQDHKIVKGNTLTVLPELPFFGLSQFGSKFLNHFNGSVVDSPLLQFMNMIDTPGILSGEKQRLSREYPFSKTAKWFADRSDLILLLFDAHKLDISDEFKEVVETIRPHNDDKIRCVLNKADSVERDQLVRVYGSLMWSMGKLFSTPEVVRVYAGSFWEKPLLHSDFEGMFNADEEWLLDELMRLPSVSAERKVNSVVKRIRLIHVHLCILGHLRQKMPRFMGHGSARQHLLDNMEQVFETVRNQHGLSEGDMPDVQEFRERLSASFDDFRIFPVLDSKDLDDLQDILTDALPKIMREASQTTTATTANGKDAVEESDHPVENGRNKLNQPVKDNLHAVDPSAKKIAKNTSSMLKTKMSFMDVLSVCFLIMTNLIFFVLLGAILNTYFQIKSL